MKKNTLTKKARAIYIQSRCNGSKKYMKTIKDIAAELFLSEQTVFNDYQEEIEHKCNQSFYSINEYRTNCKSCSYNCDLKRYFKLSFGHRN